MDREPLQQTAHDGCIQLADGTLGTVKMTSPRRQARGAWLIRAAAMVYVVSTGIIAYLVFSAA